jgi:hypothetical protein
MDFCLSAALTRTLVSRTTLIQHIVGTVPGSVTGPRHRDSGAEILAITAPKSRGLTKLVVGLSVPMSRERTNLQK